MQLVTWSPQLQSAIKSVKQHNIESTYSMDNILNKFQLSIEEAKATKAALQKSDGSDTMSWWH